MFNPDDPHCIVCDGHIDVRDDEGFVLTGLRNPETGERVAVVAHIECGDDRDAITLAVNARTGNVMIPRTDYVN
jgi:hypothetical protein